MHSAWCVQHELHLCTARRADIECFGRDMEGAGRMTFARRLCTIAGFYLLRRRRPAQALPGRPRAAAAAGLPVACGRVGPTRGRSTAGRRRPAHRCRTCADLAAGNQRAADLRSPPRGHRQPRSRTRAPHPDRAAQRRQDRHHPARPTHRTGNRPGHRRAHRRADLPLYRRPAHGPALRQPDRAPGSRRAGLDKKISPHTLRHASITADLDAGVPLRSVQEAALHADPRTTMRYDRARVSLDRHATYIVAAYLAGAAR
jgi:integrase/recombinase XerD